MKNRLLPLAAALTGLLLFSGTAAAQQTPETGPPPAAEPKTETAPPADTNWLKDRPITMQHFRPLDRRGLNMFETPKAPGVEYSGFKLDWGAAFTSQVQSLSHSNTATPVIVGGVNTNQL